VIAGICATIDKVRYGPWHDEVAMSPLAYVDAVQAAGALPLLIPPSARVEEAADLLLDRVDALVIGGGEDIAPETYGAILDAETSTGSRRQDWSELILTRRALDRRIPVLGICRGMQVLNVACGGTLVQDIEESGEERHRGGQGVFAEHEVHLIRDSLAARAAGAETLSVRSYHHQGIDTLGQGLLATGWSHPDEIVEAIELPTDHGFALGVLWHPERDPRSTIVSALVKAAGSA
jgi:putative glutamine amidotransferase